MLKADYKKYSLNFKEASGTSRGILNSKTSYFLKIWNSESPDIFGIGECSLIEGLSPDDEQELELQLKKIVGQPEIMSEHYLGSVAHLPSLRFGIEMAMLDFKNGGHKQFFRSPFSQGLEGQKINGLIWMNTKDHMLQQVKTKLAAGYSCLKLKIGAINFNDELAILRSLRKEFDEHDLEIRVDANGAFTSSEALNKLNQLDELDIHSIEQPIKAGQWQEMAALCEKSPLDIALDEELIGIYSQEDQIKLLETINPHYCIFKPSLIGGFEATYQWIKLCGELSIPWWATSALESNIGLNAVAQFTAQFYNPLPQGLGTGQLYTNNIKSPLEIKGQRLFYNSNLNWDDPFYQL
jgi:o-succinylbenzoate synthase